MHDSVNKEPKGWRGNWFVKNVLAEIPIMGGFFHKSSVTEALSSAAKETFMFAGGTAGMMLTMMSSKKDEDMTTHTAKMVGGMAGGMFAGHVVYNIFSDAGKKIKDCLSSSSKQETRIDEEQSTHPLLEG